MLGGGASLPLARRVNSREWILEWNLLLWVGDPCEISVNIYEVISQPAIAEYRFPFLQLISDTTRVPSALRDYL